ncbi:hypothetical protein DSO57_1036445 [Entomophthora muscae]|uniref:Uncharacterized protein n=1 Tax=Entomophthora muscae TaxID=34485 RepID=A0ACC2SNG0_9FUNG|nr:hypothetical protein DSO57_1036445 [Entomophthora muscae]
MLSKLPALPPVDGTPAILMDRIHAFHVHQYSKPNNSCLFITTDAHTPCKVYRKQQFQPRLTSLHPELGSSALSSELEM